MDLEVVGAFEIDEGWKNYWVALYRKLFEMITAVRNNTAEPLVIENEGNGGNFRPSAFFTKEQKKELMGIVAYDDILLDLKSKPVIAHATDYILLDGGAGSAFNKIEELVKRRFNRKNPKGSKGTDLPFKIGENEYMSVAEIKLLNLIKTVSDVKKASKQEVTASYQPGLSWDSKTAYTELLSKTAFGNDGKITYAELLNNSGISVNTKDVVTPNFPGLDLKGSLMMAPAFGSHGSIGVWLLNRFVSIGYERPKTSKIISFSNGDGVNNILPEPVAQWMLKNKAPAVMILTEKTGVDKKGGQIGIERMKDGTIRVRMLERADAKDKVLFDKMGLSGGKGTPGAQDFNTNVLGINEGLVAEIMQDLFNKVLLPKALENQSGEIEAGKAAMDEFNKIIAPDLIVNDKNFDEKDFTSPKIQVQGEDVFQSEKKDFIQIEGPIGTVFLNLSNYFEDPNNIAIKEKVFGEKVGKGLRLLTLVSTTFEQRSLVFTPIKGLFDYVLQALSDYFSLIKTEWTLDSAKEQGKTVPLPEFDLQDNDKRSYKAYKQANRVYDIVGEQVSVRGLRLLKLDGDKNSGLVLFPNASLRGNVSIVNNTTYEVDLSKANVKGLPIFKDKKLWLEDVNITVTGENTVEVTRFVDNADAGEAKDATVVAAGYGGIDFDLGDIDLGIRSEEDEIRYEMDPAILQQGDFNGLEPMIIKITPITDMPVFLGAKNEAPEMAGVAS